MQGGSHHNRLVILAGDGGDGSTAQLTNALQVGTGDLLGAEAKAKPFGLAGRSGQGNCHAGASFFELVFGQGDRGAADEAALPLGVEDTEVKRSILGVQVGLVEAEIVAAAAE